MKICKISPTYLQRENKKQKHEVFIAKTCSVVFIRLSNEDAGTVRGKKRQRIFKPINIDVAKKNIVAEL